MRLGAVLLVLVFATPAAAQSSLAAAPAARFPTAEPPRSEFHSVRRQSGAAFPVEFLGATAGSLIGLGAGLLIASPDACDNEDIGCIIERLGMVGLFSAVGAPAGTMLAGGWADTRPSLVGAAIGSLAGVAAGAGLLKLGEEIDDDPLPVLYALVAYGGAHGLLTAVGSRIGALIRD